MVRTEYHLICVPNSKAVESEANKIIQDNPTAKIVFQQAFSAPYFDRELRMDCLKCGSRVAPAQGDYMCTNCKRAYTTQDFESLARPVFTPKGTFFLQPIITENPE